MTGNKDGVSKRFSHANKFRFILREKEIAVLENLTKKECDRVCFFKFYL